MRFKLVRPLLMLYFLVAFFFFVCNQDATPAVHESSRSEPKTLEIKNVRLVASQAADKKIKRVQVNEFRETKPQHLIPSDKVDVECEIVGGADLPAGDYVLWTT